MNIVFVWLQDLKINVLPYQWLIIAITKNFQMLLTTKNQKKLFFFTNNLKIHI